MDAHTASRNHLVMRASVYSQDQNVAVESRPFRVPITNPLLQPPMLRSGQKKPASHAIYDKSVSVPKLGRSHQQVRKCQRQWKFESAFQSSSKSFRTGAPPEVCSGDSHCTNDSRLPIACQLKCEPQPCIKLLEPPRPGGGSHHNLESDHQRF